MKAMLAALAMLVATATCAAERSYAVMSLVGDGLLVVQYREKTGSSLPGTTRQTLLMADTVFDRAALVAAEEAVRRADPKAKVTLLGGRDAAVMEAQSRSLGSDGAAQAIADALRPRLPQTGATHLILVTKAQRASQLRVDQSLVDTGPLEGLGFYVDRTLLTRPEGAAADSHGLLAPFAYFTVSLVDLATGRVVAERPVYAYSTYTESKTGAINPWDALSSQEKVRILEGLVRDEAGKAVTALLAQ